MDVYIIFLNKTDDENLLKFRIIGINRIVLIKNSNGFIYQYNNCLCYILNVIID